MNPEGASPTAGEVVVLPGRRRGPAVRHGRRDDLTGRAGSGINLCPSRYPEPTAGRPIAGLAIANRGLDKFDV